MEVVKTCPSQAIGWVKLQLHNHGFSLIEFLITLAVISILAINVFPSLSGLLAQERTVVMTNHLASALAFARSESVTKNQTIITCQSSDGSKCSKSGDWHTGWIIFADLNSNKQRDDNESLLQTFSAANNGTQAVFNGAFNIDHYIKYKPTGHAFPNGSFIICNPEKGTVNALVMTRSGRLRLSKRQRSRSKVTC